MIVAGQASAAATSVAIPAHQAGDLILVFARGTAAAPTKPTAGGTVPNWTVIQSALANACGLTSVGFVATASNHTTGVFTSATHICVLVLRPDSGKVLSIGASSTGNANNTQTIVYPALTCQVVDGTSLAVRVGTRTVADSEVANPPGTYVLQTVQPAAAGALMAVFTRAVIANQTAGTVTTAGSNAASRAHTIEVLEAAAPAPTNETLIDDFNRADGEVHVGQPDLWMAPAEFGSANNLGILSNQAWKPNGAAAREAWSKIQLARDFDLLVDCTGTPSSSLNTLMLHFCAGQIGVGTQDGYQLRQYDTTTWQLCSITNGVTSVIQSWTTGLPVAGDTVWVKKTGSTIIFYRRPSGGVFNEVGRYTSATLYDRVGQFGLGIQGPSTSDPTRWDNLRGGPIYVVQTQAVSGITSPQTFGALTTRVSFGAGGVAPAVAFGTPQFKLRFVVAGVPSAQALGVLPFGPPAQSVRVPGVPPSTHDTHIVGEYLAGQALVGWTGGNQFGTPFLKNLDFVGVGGVLSAQSFGAVTIKAVISRALLGIPSAQSFGKVSLRFVLAGIPSAQAFGTPFFIAVQGLVVPPGVLSAQSFGTPRFRLIALVGGVASAQAFGTVRPRLYVQATGVTSAQAFGAPGFKLRFGGTGVGSAQAFGTLRFSFQKTILGVSSAQSFGIPKALFLVRPVGLGSAQAFGQIVIRSGPVWVVVTGLGSAQAFGSPDTYNVWVFPVSCLGVDLVGVPDYAEVLTAVADTSVALTNGVEQAVDLDAVTCVPVALDPVEIA